MKTSELTERQANTLRFIEDYLTEHGRAPSIREMCESLGGFSTNTIVERLRALEKKGHLERTPGHRGLRVLRSTYSGKILAVVDQLAEFGVEARQRGRAVEVLDPEALGRLLCRLG